MASNDVNSYFFQPFSSQVYSVLIHESLNKLEPTDPDMKRNSIQISRRQLNCTCSHAEFIYHAKQYTNVGYSPSLISCTSFIPAATAVQLLLTPTGDA